MFSISKITLCCAPLLLAFGLGSGLPIASLQAQEATPTAHFVAQLAEATDETRIVAGGVVWRCSGTQCTGSRSTARPLRICRELKRKAGELTEFMIMGEKMAENKMERCNR